MIINFLYIASGGAIGASLRYLVSHFFKIYFPYFPVGTLIVNIIGSFFIGLIANYLNSKDISEIFFKYFLIIGFLGSFTTFSAFSIETVELIKQGKILFSLLYIIFSFTLSILAAFIGISLIRFWFWKKISK